MLDTDITFNEALHNPTDDSSASGGAWTATVIPGVNPGEVLPKLVYNPTGGAVVGPWYYSFFITNINATDTFYAPQLWIPNAVVAWGADGSFTFTSDNAGDSYAVNGGQIRISGFDASGNPQQEVVNLLGTSTATSANSYGAAYPYVKFELLGMANALGNISIFRGTQVGTIPAPIPFGATSMTFNFATTEYDIAVAASLNTSVSVANRLTAPGGLSFTRPRTSAAAIVGPDITPTDKLQCWIRVTGQPGMYRSARSSPTMWVEGTD